MGNFKSKRRSSDIEQLEERLIELDLMDDVLLERFFKARGNRYFITFEECRDISKQINKNETETLPIIFFESIHMSRIIDIQKREYPYMNNKKEINSTRRRIFESIVKECCLKDIELKKLLLHINKIELTNVEFFGSNKYKIIISYVRLIGGLELDDDHFQILIGNIKTEYQDKNITRLRNGIRISLEDKINRICKEIQEFKYKTTLVESE